MRRLWHVARLGTEDGGEVKQAFISWDDGRNHAEVEAIQRWRTTVEV